MSSIALHISEIAALFDITPKTIRHYHRIGLLEEPARGENGYRLYTLVHVQQVSAIRRLQGFGLSLRQIGIILDADEPDRLLHHVLSERERMLERDIAHMQAQRARIRALLESDVRLHTMPDAEPAPISALQIVQQTIMPVSHALADVITLLEQEALARIDRYAWGDGYAEFWHRAASHIAAQMRRDEHTFMLWLERYLALAQLPPDDLQVAAWMREIDLSAARRVIGQMLTLPTQHTLSVVEDARIRRLLNAHLFESATPAQQMFLHLLLGNTGERD
jgi:DNA-binding transcriptional MerR regulator